MRFAMLGLAGLVILTGLAEAQGTSRALPDGTAVGGMFGAFVARDEALESGFVFGSLHVNRLKARGVGLAFAIAVPPEAWEYGGVLLLPDVGVAYNVSLSSATLLLKGGGSFVVGIYRGGAGALPGIHLGGTLVVRTGTRAALLVDVTEHWYLSGEGLGVASVPSIAVGVTVLPKPGK